MKTLSILILLCFFSVYNTILSQSIKGIVTDEKHQPIELANISVKGTNINAVTNSDGEFEIKLPKQEEELVISHIGYITDTVKVSRIHTDNHIILKSVSYLTDEVVVVSSKHSLAESVILKAIENRKNFLDAAGSYSTRNYSRIVIKDDIRKDSNIVIYESISDGYHVKPDKYSEKMLTVRSEISSFPKDVNTNLFGMVPSIYSDNVELTRINCISPLNESALDYFNFELLNISSQDDKKIFKISFTPRYKNSNIPQGSISIIDTLFQAVYVHLEIPQASFIPFSKRTDVTQSFRKQKDDLWMPATCLVESSLRRKVSVSQMTLINNYRFDSDDNIADEQTGTVKMNPAYWDSVQTIPPTENEKAMAHKLDSIYSSSIFAKINKAYNFFYEMPLRSFNDFYHFNRVEGHYIGLGLDSKSYLRPFSFEAKYGYGTADKKEKYFAKGSLSAGDNYKVFAYFQNDLSFFNSFYDYSQFDITFRSVFFKDDYAGYYYLKRLKAGAEAYVSKNTSISAAFASDRFYNADVNTNCSLASNRYYHTLPHIQECKANYLELIFRYDNAKYADFLAGRFKDIKQNYLTFEMRYLLSAKSVMKSDIDYYQFFGRIDFNRSYSALFNINAISEFGYANYDFPQFYFHLPAALTTLNELPNRFRTVMQDRYMGDRILCLYVQNNFSSTPLSFLSRDNTIELIAFANAARVREYVDRYRTLTEAGIAFNNVLLSGARIDFAYNLSAPEGDVKFIVSASLRF